MEKVKETSDYKVLKKRSGRYAVKDKSGKLINGVEKVKILVKEGLIKTTIPKKEAPVVESKDENGAETEEEAASPEKAEGKE